MRNEEKVSMAVPLHEVRPGAHDPWVIGAQAAEIDPGSSQADPIVAPFRTFSVSAQFKSPDISLPFDDGVAGDSARTAAHQVYRLA